MLITTYFSLILVSFSDALLTPSQPTCVGDTVEYNCTSTGIIQWAYNGTAFDGFGVMEGVSDMRTVTSNEIDFNISFTRISGISMSTLRFMAIASSNNLTITCDPIMEITETIEILPLRTTSSITLYVQYISNSSVLVTWIPDMAAIGYVVTCTLQQCNQSLFDVNESQATVPIKNYTNFNVCLTVEFLCSNFTVCSEVNPETITHELSTTNTTATFFPTNQEIRDLTTNQEIRDLTTLYLNGSSAATTGLSSSSNNALVGGVVGGSIGGILVCAVLLGLIAFLFLKKDCHIVRSKALKNSCESQNFEAATYSITSHPHIKEASSNEMYDQLHLNKKDNNIHFGRNMKQTVYAELQNKRCENRPENLFDTSVVYSGIKGTTCGDYDIDCTLDLNSLVLQLKSVEHLWNSYGRALGVPADVLSQIFEMNVEDHDKLVEVLDYWLYMHPKNVSPTWKEVSQGLEVIGFSELASEIMKVYVTGKLPVQEDEKVSLSFKHSGNSPPPLPPKIEATVPSFYTNSEDMHVKMCGRITDDNTQDEQVPPLPPKPF